MYQSREEMIKALKTNYAENGVVLSIKRRIMEQLIGNVITD
jgi:hypothetical protein